MNPPPTSLPTLFSSSLALPALPAASLSAPSTEHGAGSVILLEPLGHLTPA